MSQENLLQAEDLTYWLNQARQNPHSLIPFLQTHLHSFRNEQQIELSPNCFYKTHEGKKAWLQAISFLEAQHPLEPLQRHSGLSQSSRDHAKDLAVNGATGSIGCDGSTLEKRMKRYCSLQQGSVGETVAHQFKKKVRNHARQIVLSLVVNDGNSQRSDRNSIFNREFKHFGVSTQDSQMGFLTVINYSTHDLAMTNQLSTQKSVSNPIKKSISVSTANSQNNSNSLNFDTITPEAMV